MIANRKKWTAVVPLAGLRGDAVFLPPGAEVEPILAVQCEAARTARLLVRSGGWLYCAGRKRQSGTAEKAVVRCAVCWTRPLLLLATALAHDTIGAFVF